MLGCVRRLLELNSNEIYHRCFILSDMVRSLNTFGNMNMNYKIVPERRVKCKRFLFTPFPDNHQSRMPKSINFINKEKMTD